MKVLELGNGGGGERVGLGVAAGAQVPDAVCLRDRPLRSGARDDRLVGHLKGSGSGIHNVQACAVTVHDLARIERCAVEGDGELLADKRSAIGDGDAEHQLGRCRDGGGDMRRDLTLHAPIVALQH